MTLSEFLKQAVDLPDPTVVPYEALSSPGHGPLGPSAVLVGFGSWDAHAAQGTDAPLLLTNKGTKRRFHLPADYTSVTRFVADPPPGYLEGWALWPQSARAPRDLLPSLTLYAEDASPDSVMGLLLLLLRAARVSVDEFPRPWIEAVDEWERQGTVDQPFRSWCALESALVHQQFPSVGALTSDILSRTWGQALRFAACALANGYSPDRLPKISVSLDHARARSALHQEKHLYEDWLQHSQSLQLSLPLTGANQRRMLVDALVIEEEQLTSTAKCFYRNDITHAPLKAGFALALHIRHGSPTAKPEITITVDPRRGVHLKDLWLRLEEAESRAWHKASKVRPTGKPRYLENVDNRFEQPWYLDPTWTLIGSPRPLESGEHGTMLSWDEVQAVVWEEFNPLREVSVVEPKRPGVPVPILSLTPEEVSADAKRLVVAKWPDESLRRGLLRPHSLPEAPTVLRLLASLTQPPSRPRPVTLPELLEREFAFVYVQMVGGFAVITQSGAFILDDWTREQLEVGALETVFRNASILHARLATLLETDVPKVAKEIRGLLKGPAQATAARNLLRHTAYLGTEVAGLRGSYAIPPQIPNVRTFWVALEEQWQLNARLDTIEDEVRSLETSMRSLVEVGSSSVVRFLAVYGFAAALASAVAPFCAKMIYHWLSAKHPENDPPGWQIMVAFVLLSALFWVALYAWLQRIDPLRRKPDLTPE